MSNKKSSTTIMTLPMFFSTWKHPFDDIEMLSIGKAQGIVESLALMAQRSAEGMLLLQCKPETVAAFKQASIALDAVCHLSHKQRQKLMETKETFDKDRDFNSKAIYKTDRSKLPWSAQEEDELQKELREGLGVRQIALIHGRTYFAITARCDLLGIDLRC